MISVRRVPKNYAINRDRGRARRRGHTPTTAPQAAREIGSCVYFIRCNDGLIKIGFTTNLAGRRAAYGPGWDRVLAALPGTLAHEKACHALHADHLAKGREYFYPHPDLLAHINEIREHLGVPLLDFDTDPTGSTLVA